MKKFMKHTFALLAAALISVGAYASSAAEVSTVQAEDPPVGMYRSELTGEWISSTLMNQRPIAVMVDNEITALPHFGTSEADIVYDGESIIRVKKGSSVFVPAGADTCDIKGKCSIIITKEPKGGIQK